MLLIYFKTVDGHQVWCRNDQPGERGANCLNCVDRYVKQFVAKSTGKDS